MISTPDHCRTLASCGTKTDIEFYECEFEDEGAAFVEASAGRQDETSGPAKLRFLRRNPFTNDRNWALFLNQHKLESLDLEDVEFESEASCRAIATAEIRFLKLSDCSLDDEGAAPVESVRQGLGPKRLCFHDNHFYSSERLVAFMYALRGNTYLERLNLDTINDSQEAQALVSALLENKGLVQLTLDDFVLDEKCGAELLTAISLHPSLRSLGLKMEIDPDKRGECTKAVGDMLLVNERVEVMSFDDGTFHKGDWAKFVAPKLESNKYRKRFTAIQTIGEASTRAAVLAGALAKFASKPHLVWMLVNQNHDIVSSYLDSARAQFSISSRMCSRSPSPTSIDAH
jgi:hypothetical protein